ncbi:serine hydrolase domain-containing protein [Thalassotalea nanhaiensis]|uniref:Serine hydrolase domain-containing protein n=1 Tax=Thalassotalea nanhaiensis TaxID=3065648 RepID=A0ABY9TFJ5_9GAMM|nr:serine hydrolase domain-containing protein [Colwelliaceae bacterium SQ345]
MKIKTALTKLILPVVVSLLITTAIAAQNQTVDQDSNTVEENSPPNNIQELQEAIAELIKKNDLPAVGIAMIDETGPVWVGALGKANLENNITADEDSMFRIGSISKMFVALSVLKLVEEGKLDLMDKVAELVPEIEFENKWHETSPVRVVHLLEHTTGWDDIHLPEYAHNDPTPATLKQALDFHPHSRVSRWEPGTRSSYCNSGPPVAAYIVAKITGTGFEEYVKANFFDPIGMSTATYFLNDDVISKGVTLYNNGNEPQDYWHISMRPSGSINASSLDMSKFLQFFINRGLVESEQLVSISSLKRMERAESTNAAKIGLQVGYGLNNYSSVHKSWVYQGHNGGVNGGLAELAYIPGVNVGHVIMVNSGDYGTFKKISKLVSDYETRNLTTPDIQPNVQITDAHKKIEGLYFPINSRQQANYFIERIANIEVLSFEDNHLVRKPLLGGKPTKYYPESPILYKSFKTGLVSLTLAEDPIAGAVVHATNRVLQPINPLVAYGQLVVAVIWFISIVSSILYVLVWGIRKLNKKIPSGATISIRLWPLLSAISIISFVVLFSLGASSPFESFGVPSLYSVGIFIATIAFAVFSILGFYTTIKERATQMNRVNYWYCAISSSTHFLVTIYLFYFGVIGLMTWA